MQRALVTGAGGFVCSHLVATLLQAGYAVSALDQAFDADWRERFASYSDRLTMIAADAAHLPDLSVDVLIHGAAVTGSHVTLGMTIAGHFRANMDSTLKAMDWAAVHVSKVAMFVSSSAIYPRRTDLSAAVSHAEDAPGAPDSVYGVAKLATEQLVYCLSRQRPAEAAQPRFIAIRLGSVYGPHERSRESRPNVSDVTRWVSGALIESEIVLDNPDHTRDWTYVEDISAAVVALIESDGCTHPVYNVASGQVVSDVSIAEMIRQHIPQARLTVGMADHQGWRGSLSNRRLREDTGFAEWTPLDEGIRRTVIWLRDEIARQERV